MTIIRGIIRQLSQVAKHLIMMGGWLLMIILCLASTMFLLVCNYLGTKQAFEFLNFEPRPVKTDELFGTMFESFTPDATLAHYSALALTLTLAIAFFFAFRLGVGLFDLIRDRGVFVRRGDVESAQAASTLIRTRALWLAALAALISIPAAWDVLLFRYRLLIGVSGIEEAEVAPKLVQAWSLYASDHAALYATSLVGLGGFAYVSLTLLSCIGVEAGLRRTEECAARAVAAVEGLFDPRTWATADATPGERRNDDPTSGRADTTESIADARAEDETSDEAASHEEFAAADTRDDRDEQAETGRRWSWNLRRQRATPAPEQTERPRHQSSRST
ncbi:MAG TPA: hypothetical protein VF701_09125, partial [Thermoanaerobaculia bacterium]